MKPSFLAVRALPLAALLLTSACLVSRPEVPKPECEVDSECAEGKICGPGGRCADACKADRDCSAPRTCQTGACVLPTGSCGRDTDCQQGQVCSTGSRCATACTTAAQCSATEACVGGACTSLSSGACRFNSECPSPQACVQGRCAEACLDARDCPFGTTCDSNLCVPPAPGCLDATDCQSGQACSPQGDCVTACTTATECAATGEACSNGACVRVGPDTAGLSGAVVLTGVTDRSGLTVAVEGPNRATGVTAADGSYTFLGLLPGLYRVTVTAAGTLEGSATREVPARVGTTTMVPAFTLTPAGDITGTVTLAGRTSHEGIQVVALGTGQGTVTGPTGAFTLARLPVGAHDLLIAYTGYQAAQVAGVAVAYDQATAINPVQLQPVPSGSTFAFSSLPPASTPINQPFAYQAVAGGGGVAAVTYAMVDGPSGASINPNTGQVTWQPTGAYSYWFALSATGGGATVYQLFYVQVLAAADQVYDVDVDWLTPVDGGAWLYGSSGLAFIADDAGVTAMPTNPSVRGTLTSVEQLNGRTVTSWAVPGGTITGVRGPVGTLTGSWEGGVVASLAGVDVHAVQSSTLLGGVAGTATAPSADTVASVSWPSGSITSTNDGRSTATGFRANTGLISTVSSTGFDDAAGTWTPDALNSLCVMNALGTVRIGITSHTATTFVLDEDPTGRLTAGQRYFVGACSGAFQTAYTFIDANRTSTPAASTRYIDIYAAGVQVGNYALTATTPPPNSTLTFNADIALYAALQNAAATGFYAIGFSTYHDVVITDSSGPWSTTTATSSWFTWDDFSQPRDIISSTATTLTVRVPTGSLATDRTGRGWVLTDTGWDVQVTVTLTTGGLGAVTGEYLWMDARGEGYLINANTANTVTLDIDYGRFPLLGLPGSLVGRSAYGGSYLPVMSVPTAGLVAGAHAGRQFNRLTNGSTPVIQDEVILSNTASAVLVDELYCYACVGGLAQRLAGTTGARWAPGAGASVDFRLALSGSPGFAPDALRGRSIVLDSNRAATGLILGNDASSVVLQVSETWFAAFRGLVSGETVWLSDAASGSTSILKVKLVGQGAAWTPGAWVGHSVVAPNNTVAGLVTANTATELDVSITNTSAFLALSPGANFAFAKGHVQGVGCASPAGYVRADFTLQGATLTPNAYTHVRSSYSSSSTYRLQLYGNSTTGAVAYVCATSFGNVINMMGRRAAFDFNGTLTVTVDDSSAAMTPNAHVGKLLYVTGSGGGDVPSPISANTATSFTVAGITSYDWLFNAPATVQTGSRYVVSNANFEVEAVATVTPALVAGELQGHLVRAFDHTASFSSSFTVGQNGATTITFVDVSPSNADTLRTAGNPVRHLTISRGSLLRLTDSSANYVPGEHVGRTLRLGSQNLTVTANTATSVTAASTLMDALGLAHQYSSWTLSGGYQDPAYSGEGAFATSDGRIALLSRSGAVSWVTAFSGAQALTVSAEPLVTGVMANDSTTGGFTTTWTDSGWSFAPNSLTTAYVRARTCSSAPTNFPVASNTTTSITGYGTQGCSSSNGGARYGIDRATLNVTGTTLTPGALRGKRLWVNGFEYLVRDNTATQVQLRYLDDYSSSNLLRVVENGGTAWVLDGPRPGGEADIVVREGTGVWTAGGTSAAYLAYFDGTRWTRTEGATVGTQVATGAVTAVTASNTFVDSSATLTPGALTDKVLLLGGVRYLINSNTINSITVSGSWSALVPPLGTTWTAFEDDGLSYPEALAIQGSALWVGTGGVGVLRKVGSVWTRFTRASTESAPGAGDGLLNDDVSRVGFLPDGRVYVVSYYDGASLFSGTAWANFTVANTESAAGLGDGLPDDDVYSVTQDAQGRLWFATGSGAARLEGTSTWRVYGPALGLGSYVNDVWVSGPGDVHLGTNGGLYRITP